MWCSDCQQDVPAVTRSASEPLVCPRCQRVLQSSAEHAPSDAGIALESFDRSKDDLSPPIDWAEAELTRQQLREIHRKLNTPVTCQRTLAAQRSWVDLSPPPVSSNPEPLRSVSRRAAAEPTAGAKPTRTTWVLSLMLCCGVIAFGMGLGMLIWSAAFQLPQLWQSGLTMTIGAEGLLILSLTWMAARLWRNGRRVNRQLHGVDQQLAEIEQITGALAGSHTTSSQHYYHHFSQAASPHMLVANLQGQVDQLASRIVR